MIFVENWKVFFIFVCFTDNDDVKPHKINKITLTIDIQWKQS